MPEHYVISNRCPPAEFYKLLDSIIKKQGIYHPTDKGTGVCMCAIQHVHMYTYIHTYIPHAELEIKDFVLPWLGLASSLSTYINVCTYVCFSPSKGRFDGH